MKSSEFRDLKVWQKAMDLAEEVYILVKYLPREETYSLSDQMRRAAISIPSNIAEGQGRITTKEFIRFLSMARGSLWELSTQIELCERLHFLNKSQTKNASMLITEVAKMLKGLRGKIPLFGICLGHQLIALSYGAKTYRLKFGHRGGNHPVKELSTGRIEITSQNHGYAVDEASLEGSGLKVTHVNLLDGTVEGLACEEDKVFCVQYHPESAPGPQDSMHLFERFTDLMGGAEYR